MRTTPWQCLRWLLLAVVPAAAGKAELPRPITREAGPGIEYFHHQLAQGPWSIHGVKFEFPGTDLRLAVTLAQGTIFGLSPVTAQIRTLPHATGEPLAAVNGDFFVIAAGPYQGDPRGVMISEGELVSAPTGGACFWLEADGQPRIGQVRSRLRAIFSDGTKWAMGLNQQPLTNEAVLFTPALGPSTRATNAYEVVLEPTGNGPWLPLRAGVTCRGRVRAVHRHGNSPLTRETMVLCLPGDFPDTIQRLQPGAEVRLITETVPDLRHVRLAVGGGPILLSKGKPARWTTKPVRHPRTALGWNDRSLYLVVVDGRQPALSVGMTYAELAAYLAQLGCHEAINLDGGGSSTLWAGGRVRNSPSDGHERAVANGLVVMRTAN